MKAIAVAAYIELLPKITSIARDAGEAIMTIYANSTNVAITKTDKSPLTQADLASDCVISNGLRALNLGWPLRSEEAGISLTATWMNFNLRYFL